MKADSENYPAGFNKRQEGALPDFYVLLGINVMQQKKNCICDCNLDILFKKNVFSFSSLLLFHRKSGIIIQAGQWWAKKKRLL